MERKIEFKGKDYRLTLRDKFLDGCDGCCFRDTDPTNCDEMNKVAREKVGRGCYYKHIYVEIEK